MRIRLIYFSAICSGILLFVLLISATTNPERQILGEWKEVKWEYEKVNQTDANGASLLQMQDDVKQAIGQHLVIHEAETWTFLPNGQLRLSGKVNNKIVSWRLKGRGHILQIKYDRNQYENYVIDKLDDGTMCLQFETDVQARGIAKLIFSKEQISQSLTIQ